MSIPTAAQFAAFNKSRELVKQDAADMRSINTKAPKFAQTLKKLGAEHNVTSFVISDAGLCRAFGVNCFARHRGYMADILSPLDVLMTSKPSGKIEFQLGPQPTPGELLEKQLGLRPYAQHLEDKWLSRKVAKNSA